MIVSKGRQVKVQYEGRLETGKIIDKTKEGQPFEFTVGNGQVIPAFEKSVEGMEIGEKKEFKIEPENAYGARKEDLVREVPRSKVPENITPEEGRVLKALDSSGQSMLVKITNVTDESVKIDFNHPLAGEKLIFEVKIVDIK